MALPAEHGGWGFLAEPAVLGLALSPSAAGAALALAALAAFLLRHPFRLLHLDRRRGAFHPRTALAARVMLLEASAALALVLLAVSLARAPFWPALALAAPAALVALFYDVRGRSREAVAEIAGALALAGSAPAIVLAGGGPPGPALGGFALLGLRAATSVLYVRARLRLDRGQKAPRAAALASHAVAVVAATGLALVGVAPWLGAVGLALQLARAQYGLSRWRRAVRPQVLGYQELVWGVLNLILLILGYRLGL